MRFFLAYQDSPSRTRPFSSSFSSSLQILNTSHSRCRSLPRSRCSKSSFKSRVPVSASVFVSSVSPSSSCLRRSSFLPPLERRKHMGNLSSHPSFFHASSSPIQRHLSHTLAIRSFRIQTSPLSCSLSSSSSSPKSLLTSPSSDVSSSLSSFSSSLSSLFSLTSFLHYHLFSSSSSLTTSPLSSSPPVFRHNPLSSLNPSFSFSFSSSSSSPSHSPSSSSSSLSPSPRVRSIEAFLLREGYEAFRLDQILLHMYGSRGGSQGRATPGKKNFRFPVRRLSGMTTLSKHLLQDLHRLIHTQLYPTPSSLSSSSLRSCRDSDLSKEKSKNDVVTQPHKRRRRREEEEETEGRSEEEEAAEYMENLGERKIFSPPAMERQMRREDTSPKEKLATEEERRRRRTRDKGKALEDSYERAEEEEEKEDERNTSHTSLSLDSSSSSSSSAFSPSSSFSTSFSRKLDELRGEERFEKNSSSFLQVPKDDFLSVYPLEEKDGKRSRKILFTCKKDSARVEAVSLRFSSHHSLCISTQAGCAFNCSFCSVGKSGFLRHLTADEMADQVLFFMQQKMKIDSVALMGMGEPLSNPKVFDALDILTHPKLIGMSARKISISTLGILPGIKKLNNDYPQVNLAFSLHSPYPEERNRLVPANRMYPFEEVFALLDERLAKTGRRVWISYILIQGKNASDEHARAVASILRERRRETRHLYHVNLIPYNKAYGVDPSMETPSRSEVVRFHDILKEHNISVSIRNAFGVDIDAACGQMHAEYELNQLTEQRLKTSCAKN